MRRPFVRRHSLIPCFSLRLDLSCERFTKRFKVIQLLLLLIDRFVQFLDQVFLEGDFCFDVYDTFFNHEVALKVRRLAGEWRLF